MWDRYRVKSPVKGSNQVDLSRDHSVRKTAMWIVWKRASHRGERKGTPKALKQLIFSMIEKK